LKKESNAQAAEGFGVKGSPLVVCGMSGGVDSSVSAYLLKKQGYNVVGLFMKNWEEQDECGYCTAAKDWEDVKRVCEKIGIPYYAINFADKYMERVFNHFLKGLENGITPNPDILCNREIKFGPFLEFADKLGADYIATGHYARVNEQGQMLKGIDPTKDQSYFLCALNQKQLSRVIFPVGGLLKSEVRKIAREQGFITADKKDSTGICFIGERNFKNFMQKYLGDKEGDIKTLDEKVVGRHSGLSYYTIGQRKGMGIGAGADTKSPWYVVRKDLATNTLYVNNGDCEELYSKTVICKDFNFIIKPTGFDKQFCAKVRYRQPDQNCSVFVEPTQVRIVFTKPQRAVTLGQWVVLYDGEVCLGGGEITGVEP
jgi:tRNA-specific 2-thiouridylase